MQPRTGHCINTSNKFRGDSLLLAFAAAQLMGLEDPPGEHRVWVQLPTSVFNLQFRTVSALGNSLMIIPPTDPYPPKSPVSGFLIVILDGPPPPQRTVYPKLRMCRVKP